MFLVAWITFISVFGAYQQTTQAAEWVAGTIAAVGAAPMLTALLVGGAVVAGGVAAYKIATTDAEDYRSFASGIKQGFQEFVADQEKQILLEQNQSLTEQEAADQGVAIARDKVNSFFSNAITTTKNTVKNIPLEISRYWSLYNKIIGNVADNGLGGVDIQGFSTHNYTNYSGFTNPTMPIASNIITIDGKGYAKGGTIKKSPNNDIEELSVYDYATSVSFPCMQFFIHNDVNESGVSIEGYIWRTEVNKDTGNIVRINSYYYSSFRSPDVVSAINSCIAGCTVPVFINNTNGQLQTLLQNQWSDLLSIGGSSETPKTWERTINNTLNNTKFGDAIQTGRKQLVNNGDWIGSIYQEDSVPVNKTGINEVDGVMSGSIGWQIPQTWDDYFSGGIPFRDVVGGTGSIGVPVPDIVPDIGTYPDRKVIEWPADADIQDSADYPIDDPDDPTADPDKPQEIPDKPAQDVLDEQGGSYYPTAIDLTNFFPFCIPFDIIYLVDKFDAHGEQAPVITIPIVYPQMIQGAMGTTGYEVVIDFQDFIVVRNVIRTFLLILFIIGLMKITRDLIRG